MIINYYVLILFPRLFLKHNIVIRSFTTTENKKQVAAKEMKIKHVMYDNTLIIACKSCP